MAPSPFKAIIFDMDGVLVDSEPRHQQAFREVFQELGYGSTHGMVFDDYLGKSDLVLWKDFIAKHQPSQSLEALLQWRQERLIQIVETEQPLFPGVPELLEALHAKLPLALASGSLHPVINAVLAIQDIRRFFSSIISSIDVERGKPALDIFLRTAQALKIAPASICVIEDSEAGVEAGLASGMHVVAITNSLPRERLTKAHHVVDRYQEIADYLGVASGVVPG